jgi:hypothetical protein
MAQYGWYSVIIQLNWAISLGHSINQLDIHGAHIS